MCFKVEVGRNNRQVKYFRVGDVIIINLNPLAQYLIYMHNIMYMHNI